MGASSVLDLIFRTRKTGTGIKDTQSGLRDLNGMLGKLGIGAISVVGALAALHQGFDMAQEGAQILRLRAAGEGLAASFGESMDDVVEAIQEGAQGGISEMDALAAANRAMTLGVGRDAATLGELMEVAAARGRIMGLSATQAFSDIVTGIGRMSPLILDNLGILTTALPEGLSGAQRQAALLAMVLEDGARQIEAMGGMVPDAATAFERLGAASADAADRLKAALGEAFAPFVEFMARTIELENQYADQTAEVNRVTGELGLTMERGGAIVVVNGERIRMSGQQLLDFVQTQGLLIDSTEEMGEVTAAVTSDLSERLSGLDDETLEVRDHMGGIGSTAAAAFGTANTSLADLIGNMRDTAAWIAGGGLQLQAEAQRVADLIASGQITPEQAEAMFQPIEAAALGLQVDIGQITLTDAQRQMIDDWGGTWGDARTQIQNARTDILNIPEQVRTMIAVEVQANIVYGPRAEDRPEGFQHGGSFIVQGPPGVDRVPVMFMATAGEPVTVGRPGDRPGGGNSLTIGQINVNSGTDEQALLAFFRRRLT